MESRGFFLLLVLLLLIGGASAVLLVEQWNASRRETQTDAFQRLVGGMGFGPAVDLSGCAFSFDPRLDGSCSHETGPLPGGAWFCPGHSVSIMEYGPLDQGEPGFVEEQGSAPLP